MFSLCAFSLCFLSVCFLFVCFPSVCFLSVCFPSVGFLSVFSVCVFSICVFSLCVFSLCVFCLCFLSMCSLCVFCLCVFCLCVFSLFSLCVFCLCVFCLCVFSLCFALESQIKDEQPSGSLPSPPVPSGRLPAPAVGRYLKPADLPAPGRLPAIKRRCLLRVVKTGDVLYYEVENNRMIHFRECSKLSEMISADDNRQIVVVQACLCLRAVWHRGPCPRLLPRQAGHCPPHSAPSFIFWWAIWHGSWLSLVHRGKYGSWCKCCKLEEVWLRSFTAIWLVALNWGIWRTRCCSLVFSLCCFLSVRSLVLQCGREVMWGSVVEKCCREVLCFLFVFSPCAFSLCMFSVCVSPERRFVAGFFRRLLAYLTPHISYTYPSPHTYPFQTYPTNTYPFKTYPTNTYPCDAYPHISHTYIQSKRIPPIRIRSTRIRPTRIHACVSTNTYPLISLHQQVHCVLQFRVALVCVFVLCFAIQGCAGLRIRIVFCNSGLRWSAYSYCVLQFRVALVCAFLLCFAIQGCAKTTKTPPQKHYQKNTTTPAQKHHHKNTTTPPQKHHHKNTPQKHHHTTTKTPPQEHHQKNTTTPPWIEKTPCVGLSFFLARVWSSFDVF